MGTLQIPYILEKLEDGSSVAIVEMKGSIDGSTVKKFESDMMALAQRGVKYLLLNFAKIGYMNSTGLGILVKVLDKYQEGDGDMKLVQVPKKVHELFDMLGISSILQIYNSVESALDTLPCKLMTLESDPEPEPMDLLGGGDEGWVISAEPEEVTPELQPMREPIGGEMSPDSAFKVEPTMPEAMEISPPAAGIEIFSAEPVEIVPEIEAELVGGPEELAPPAQPVAVPIDIEPPKVPTEPIAGAIEISPAEILEAEPVEIPTAPEIPDASPVEELPELFPASGDIAQATPVPETLTGATGGSESIENTPVPADTSSAAKLSFFAEAEKVPLSDQDDKEMEEMEEMEEISEVDETMEEISEEDDDFDDELEASEHDISSLDLANVPKEQQEALGDDTKHVDSTATEPEVPDLSGLDQLAGMPVSADGEVAVDAGPVSDIPASETEPGDLTDKESSLGGDTDEGVISEADEISIEESLDENISEDSLDKTSEGPSGEAGEEELNAKAKANTETEDKPMEKQLVGDFPESGAEEIGAPGGSSGVEDLGSGGLSEELGTGNEMGLEAGEFGASAKKEAKEEVDMSEKKDSDELPSTPLPPPISEPVPPPAPMPAPAFAPMPAPAPMPEPVAAAAPIKRKTAVRYYEQMNPQNSYPMVVAFSKEAIKKVQLDHVKQVSGQKTVQVKKEEPEVTVTPCLSGCLITPPNITVDVTPETATAEFWVTPVIQGNIAGWIDISYQGKSVEKIPLQTKSVKQTIARVSAFIASLTPVVSFILDGFNLNLQQQAFKGFPKLLAMIDSQIGLLAAGGICMGVFAVTALFFYLRNRPKEAEILEQFLEVNPQETV